MDSKQALRQQADARRSVSVDLSQIVSTVIAQAERIASYVSFGTEPGVPPQPGWLLPVLLPDGDLDWTAYDGRIVGGRPPEPVGDRLGVAAIASCDLVLVPALLVDRRGVRLGKGGGSYDRALARATGLTVALLHDGELVERLPAEPHDVPVDAVATPSGGLVRLSGKM